MIIEKWVMFSSWLFRKAGEILNKRQSSDQAKYINIKVIDKGVALTTNQLDNLETIHILEVCLKSMKEETSLKEVPIGKDKENEKRKEFSSKRCRSSFRSIE